MKNLLFLLVFSVVIAGFGISGCKKYAEGPTLSLASKKSRVVNVWKIDKILINAVDKPLGNDDKATSLEFKKDNTFEIKVESYSENGITVPASSNLGTWEFDSAKENIIMKYSGAWAIQLNNKILKLKSNELWLEYTFTWGATSYIYVTHYVTM